MDEGKVIDENKVRYMRLNYIFYVYLACLAVPFLGVDLNGGLSALWILVFAVSHLAYLYLLGVLILRAKRSFWKWVGLTFISGPLGTIISYLFLKPVAIEQGWS